MFKLLGTLLVVLALEVATPMAAQACACGGFVGDQKVQVKQETAIVSLTGGRETVTMQFAAETTATRAAWIMPVPAKADLSLGNADAFTYLDDFTKPEYRDVVDDSGPGDGRAAAAPPGSGVTVTEQTKIGPYEIAQLTGSDSAAVAAWLTQNGFTLPANLATGLQPYLAEGWSLTAIRLTGSDGGSLQGVLPPLQVSFATSTPVYPMRLSGQATTPQALRLYVLADHRMDASSPARGGGTFHMYFAGRDDARGTYVTRYDGQWSKPSMINEDIRLTQSATDDPHREVVVRHVQAAGKESPATSGPWLFIGGIVLLVVIVAGVLIIVGMRAKRR
jgi:hypothetical protein